MADLLLTTLGITWQIVPELYAFTNTCALDLVPSNRLWIWWGNTRWFSKF
jgi:hypothetical protein